MADRRPCLKTSLPGDPALAMGAMPATMCVASIQDAWIAVNQAAWAIQPGGSRALCDAQDQRAPIPSKSVLPA